MRRTRKKVVLLALFSLLLIPVVSMAGEFNIQTFATGSNATAGESGATVDASVLISVVVTANGVPQKNLGTTVGDGTAAITLPTGWKLITHVAPPGGCIFSPTEFYNWGDGSYSIRVVPFLSTEGCAWLEGDYHYIVQLSKPGKPAGFVGSGLGVLTIK